MLQQVKQILARGFPNNKKSPQAIKDTGVLQTFYKKHTGRWMSGCTCKRRELYSAVRNILLKKGEDIPDIF